MKKVVISTITVLALVLALVAACAAPAGTATTATKTTTITATATAAPTTVTKTATVTATATTAAPKVFKWSVPTWMTKDTDIYKFCAVEWADMLRKASGGRLDFTPSAGGEVVPYNQMLDAAQKGSAPMVLAYAGYETGKFAAGTFASEAPAFTLRSMDELLDLLYNYGVRDILRDAYAKQFNVYYLREQAYRTPYYVITKFPINKASDFKGKVIRVYGTTGDVLAKVGASTVTMAASDVYGALEKGTIDGCITGTLTYIFQKGFHEVAKNVMFPAYVPGAANSILFNMDAWNSLPQDLRDLISATAAESTLRYSASLAETEGLNLAAMISKWGVKTTTLPAEEVNILADYSLQVTDTFAAKDPIYNSVTVKLKELMKALGYL